MAYKKYNEIENANRQKNMDFILGMGFASVNIPWCVTEKCHGSNFQLFTEDGLTVHMGKRTEALADDCTDFYNCQQVLNENREKVIAIFNLLKSRGFIFDTLRVFGEIAGGNYPHKDVLKVQGQTMVQKGIYYNSRNFLYAFDIYIENTTERLGYINYETACECFEAVGMVYAKIMFKGTLEECMKVKNDSPSTIHTYFNLPPIDGNIIEGLVLKPIEALYFDTGERAILKSKNEKWGERTTDPKPKHDVKIDFTTNPELKPVYETLCTYLTENRLRNVISKENKIEPKDFGKLLGELVKDAMADYQKDNVSPSPFDNLEKESQHRINKMINQSASNLIRKSFVNILDGNF